MVIQLTGTIIQWNNTLEPPSLHTIEPDYSVLISLRDEDLKVKCVGIQSS